MKMMFLKAIKLVQKKPKINQDAVRLLENIYNIDMEHSQYSKILNDIPEGDIVITMRCHADCPTLPCQY